MLELPKLPADVMRACEFEEGGRGRQICQSSMKAKTPEKGKEQGLETDETF